MPQQPSSRYDLKELAARAGVTARTVHFYVQQGLLPPAGQPGPGARYSEAHLARLILIRRLQREHLPLAEIRNRLQSLDDETVQQLAAASRSERKPPAASSGFESAARQATSALEYIRGILGGPTRAATPREVSRLSAPRDVDSHALWLSEAMPRAFEERVATRAGQDAFEERVEARPSQRTDQLAPPPAPPARSQWERLVLSPDIELHIRRPLTRDQNKRVERLVHMAREILQEGDV